MFFRKKYIKFDMWYHSESKLASCVRNNYRMVKNSLINLFPLKIVFIYIFRKNLILLNDILSRVGFEGKYWVWGGLLLGWAREGKLLHFDNDADFGFFSEDRNSFIKVMDKLIEAGFKFEKSFINKRGVTTEYVFCKNYRRFEFFEFDKKVDGVYYWLYSSDHICKEAKAVMPWDGKLATFDFLERTWNKPADHESFLTAIYGDWLIPNSGWHYIHDNKSIITDKGK